MRQYVLEIEYTLVVENMADDPGEVSDDFIARLTELAASNPSRIVRIDGNESQDIVQKNIQEILQKRLFS